MYYIEVVIFDVGSKILLPPYYVHLKGQCHEIFRFWFFSSISFPQPQSIPLGLFRIFSKICGDIRSSRLTTGVVDTGGKWEKSSIRKILIILLGHLWIVELTHIYIFAFKFTLMYLQPEINPIVSNRCQRHRRQIWYRWQFATGVVDTGSKFAAGIVDTGGKFATGINNTSETGGKICHRCRWYRWSTLSCEYLREFSK